MKKIVTLLNCIVLSSIMSTAFSQVIDVKLKPHTVTKRSCGLWRETFQWF